jgi:hypothetical protein
MSKDITNINKGKNIVGMLCDKQQVPQRTISKGRNKFAISPIGLLN